MTHNQVWEDLTSTAEFEPEVDNLIYITRYYGREPTDQSFKDPLLDMNFTDTANTGNYSNPPITAEITFHKDADIMIASLTIILIVFALIGNSFALLYFSKTRKLNVPCFLYKLISIFEICMAFHIFPLVFSLIKSRSPVFFANKVLCTFWATVFYFLKR